MKIHYNSTKYTEFINKMQKGKVLSQLFQWILNQSIINQSEREKEREKEIIKIASLLIYVVCLC